MLALAHQLPVDKDLAKAKKKAGELDKEARGLIKVMSAEEALKAQRVIREAGKRK